VWIGRGSSFPSLTQDDPRPGDRNEGEGEGNGAEEEKRKLSVWNALEVVIAAAVRSGESKEVKKEVDKERSGIAMWRIP